MSAISNLFIVNLKYWFFTYQMLGSLVSKHFLKNALCHDRYKHCRTFYMKLISLVWMQAYNVFWFINHYDVNSNWILCLIVFVFFSLRNLLRWKNGDSVYKAKWKPSDIGQINIKLNSFISHRPREIHRTIRNLDVLKFWKGTEFRTFLLYYGMVALRDHLSEEVYYHYITLVCAVTIFYTDSYHLYREKAAEWLNRYIEGCVNIYGIHSITSNLHNLTHVFNDVKLFGSLQNLSTYPFENHLNFLKRRLKQPNLPLEQITRRLVELSKDYDDLYSFDMSMTTEEDPMPQLSF